MERLSVNLKCPKCGLPGEASLEESAYKCILFICPRCRSNVVYYDNKIDVITDTCLSRVLKRKKLQFCGSVNFNKDNPDKGRKSQENSEKKSPLVHEEGKPITRDDVLNLKILLATEGDIDSILSQI